jgi:hypothetical protein
LNDNEHELISQKQYSGRFNLNKCAFMLLVNITSVLCLVILGFGVILTVNFTSINVTASLESLEILNFLLQKTLCPIWITVRRILIAIQVLDSSVTLPDASVLRLSFILANIAVIYLPNCKIVSFLSHCRFVIQVNKRREGELCEISQECMETLSCQIKDGYSVCVCDDQRFWNQTDEVCRKSTAKQFHQFIRHFFLIL